MTLTAESITELLSQSRDRGGYERFIRSFVHSGEAATVVTDAVQFSAKKVPSLYNSMNQNISKLVADHSEWRLKLVKQGEDELVLINLDAYEALLASQNGSSAENDSDTE